MPSTFLRLGVAFLFISQLGSAIENTTPPAPNSDPTYQQLRNIQLGSDAVAVKDLTLKRDAATFHLNSGMVCFVAAVQGKVTGAVFSGDGNVTLGPPVAAERRSLKLLTRGEEFNEQFSRLVLRFTDSTYDEIKKAGSSVSAGCESNILDDSLQAARHDRELRFNMEGRILQDVLGTEPGGFFVAFIHGTRYDDKEIFAIDPHGAPPFLSPPVDPRNVPALILPPVTPEEVELITYDENKAGIWAAFHLHDEYQKGIASGSQNNEVMHIEHQQLDTTIEKNANLAGKATTTFVSQVNGLRVVPFNLFNRLRVQSVTADGQQLSFIQEAKEDDAQYFSVILPKALGAGEKVTIVTSYSGKDAVTSEGSGNYYPVARENWYPNAPSAGFGDYTNYDLTFRIPKGMKIAATGTLVSESVDGDHSVSVWKSEGPQTVAGFNFGKFKVEQGQLTKPDYTVLSYANENPPDWVQQLLISARGNEFTAPRSRMGIPERPEVALGNMSTTTLSKKALSEGELAIGLYTDYFGPIPFHRLAMTQQTACTFGQSWPTLVWLPICSFFDTTVRNQLGLEFADRGYWKTVAAHEVAHQWWGHAVGFNSYRDQWMSEGFADMSASLFIQEVEKDPKKFIEFWNDERWLLTARNKENFRANDAGPLTQGYRLDNSRTGYNTTRMLMYPKGAYVLHMIRMMMWDRQTGDTNFKAMMQDFVKTYSGRAATTDDFKAMVEKHQTKEMAALGGGKMNWFFDEYVWGTALPTYNVDFSFDKDSSGDALLNFKVTQSSVDENFRMLVPLYIEMADGRTIFLGRARLIGNTTLEQKVPLKGVKDAPHRVLVNYYDDVLASAD